jgi:Glycosyltransferase family 87
MTNARRDGLYLLLLGCAVFVLLGSALESISPVSMTDFRAYYYSARCLVAKQDPYNAAELTRIYHAQEKERPADSAKNEMVITRYIYFPFTFAFTAPLALLPFGLCHVLWMIANASFLILAGWLTWDLSAPYGPIISGSLIGFLLANSELVLVTGNIVGVAIGLCLVAFWCFSKKRLEWLGAASLAIGLILKPHDAVLVWLYFLLAGGIFRRRALQTLGIAAILSLPGLVWVTAIAPHWIGELRSNMAQLSVHGGITDPGPSSSGAHALAMQINLQTAVSMFRDDPAFYNPICYAICGVLFIFWAAKILRSQPSPQFAWTALAAAAPLTMLPVYHRQADAKLLLLTIPAATLLWSSRCSRGRWALIITAAGLVITAEIPWAIALDLLKHIRLPDTQWSRQLLIGAQILPIPVILLVVTIFYLAVLMKSQPDAVGG